MDDYQTYYNRRYLFWIAWIEEIAKDLKAIASS